MVKHTKLLLYCKVGNAGEVCFKITNMSVRVEQKHPTVTPCGLRHVLHTRDQFPRQGSLQLTQSFWAVVTYVLN